MVAFHTINESCRVSEGNPTSPEGTFLTLQYGEPNDLPNATQAFKLHKSFDRGQITTSIQL